MAWRLSTFYQKISRPGFIFFSLLSTFTLLLSLSWIDHRISHGTLRGVIAFQFAFTPKRVGAVFDFWGPGGVALFRKTLWLDYLFPIAYSLLISGLMIRRDKFRRGFKPSRQLYYFLPFIAALFDYLENSLQYFVSLKPQDISALATWGIGIFAGLKLGFLFISLVILVFFFGSSQMVVIGIKS